MSAEALVPQLASDYGGDLVAIVLMLVCFAVLLCLLRPWSGPRGRR